MSVDLTLLDPILVEKIGIVLDAMQKNGTPMRITDGYRTTGEQALLYAQGRTLKGAIVTHLDGIHVKSKHQTGRAVDCCFLGPVPYADVHPWGKYGDEVRRQGLFWGGDFSSPDRPHAELKDVK